MKVALVYDRVNKWGGAERVLLALHELFPDAPLFTSVYNPATASWAKVFTIKTSFLQQVPLAKSRHEYFPLFMPLAFENFSFDDFDLIISVTSEAAKGIITKPSTKHICICLTPTRYLWSGYEEYFKNSLIQLLVLPFVWYLRLWDRIASKRPDQFIAISKEVQKRIKEYYGQESKVVYPPLMLKVPKEPQPEVNRPLDKKEQKGSKKGYFLVVSRLSRFTSYKRVDIAIKAATQLDLPLIVVGEGNKQQFQKFAGSNVQFVGKVSDEDLASYYAGCRALIFPALEDFGLVMVEAQTAGKPVIAYRGGGAVEIIQEGKTGAFFNKQTIQSLVEVLKTFKESDYNSQVCKSNAERFSKEKFQKEIVSVIESTH